MEVQKYIFQEFNTDESNDSDKERDAKNSEQDNNIEEKLKKIIEETQKKANEQANLLRENAKKEGFEAGYREGLENARREMEESFKKTTDEYLDKIQESLKLIVDFKNELDKKYKDIENSATDAVLEIVSKVISKKIEEDKDIIANMVKEALGLSESKSIKIKLNPQDASNLRNKDKEIFGSKKVEIVEDDSLARGSILIEEENGNIIDAGLESKMNSLSNSVKNE